MTLQEDLEELNLLVPDAPTLTADVREHVCMFGAEAAALVMAAAGWQSEAASLADQLEAQLAELAEDAKMVEKAIESGIAIVVGAFDRALAELADTRGELGAAQDLAEKAVEAVASSASAAATFVSTACENAAATASQQLQEFEAQRQRLQSALLLVSYVPLIDEAGLKASTAAGNAGSTIAAQLRRLGPSVKSHVTDSSQAVAAHVNDLRETVGAVMEGYRSGAEAMAEDLFGKVDEAFIEVSMAAEQADTAAEAASTAVAEEARRLAEQGEAFVAQHQELEQDRDGLTPYFEAAERCRVQLGGQ